MFNQIDKETQLSNETLQAFADFGALEVASLLKIRPFPAKEEIASYPPSKTRDALDLRPPGHDAIIKSQVVRPKPLTIRETLAFLDLADQTNTTLIPTSVRFSGPEFKDHMPIKPSELEELLQSNALVEKDMQIAAYDKNEAHKRFKFPQNRFEFIKLDESITASAKHYSQDYEESKLNQALIPLLERWAKNYGFEFDQVIPVNTQYRNLDPQINSNRDAKISHIDFKDLETILPQLDPNWKEQDISGKKAFMVNIWIPLNPTPTDNTLALMDPSRIKPEDLHPFTAHFQDTKITAQILSPSNRHQYVILKDIKLGDAIIFDTLRTPHTAVNVPRPESVNGGYRTSVEVRFLFIKNE